MNLGLNNKTILITGGSAGIGKATALAFAQEEGVRIAISYFSKKDDAQVIVNQINNSGGNAMAVFIDLANHESMANAINTIAAQWGGVDVLVNNAVQWGNPANRGKNFEDIGIDQWQQTVGINLFGTVKITQLVAPFMRQQQWGRIINISSDLAFQSMKSSGPYSTLKSSLIGFTANLVEELSADGVLTNMVIPSWTLTDRAKTFFPEAFHKLAAKAFPTGRVTQPEDVASLIAYLGSAANGHVNGELIRATGAGTQPILTNLFKEFAAQQHK